MQSLPPAPLSLFYIAPSASCPQRSPLYKLTSPRTLCGTPNYIAPEILDGRKGGHSFEVDIWSIGCILYTMLIGKPPFETRDIKTTYRKIKHNDYRIPSSAGLSEEAKNLIRMTLHSDPLQRPSPQAILQHPFLSRCYVPVTLPPSALQMRPDLTGVPAAAPFAGNAEPLYDVATTAMAAAGRAPLGSLNAPRQVRP